MTPELNHIYRGDCIEVMKSWPDKCVDLIITDPPYGMNFQSNMRFNKFKKIEGDADSFPVHIFPELFRLARGGVFVFCRWDNLVDIPKPKSFIVWAKNNMTMGDLEHEYGRSWEGCAFYPMEGHRFNRRPPDIVDCRKVPSGTMVHPTQKPVPLIESLLIDNAGDVVLDPFCGSGTTLVAAARCNRSYIGIEMDEAYHKIAAERVALDTAQGKMF